MSSLQDHQVSEKEKETSHIDTLSEKPPLRDVDEVLEPSFKVTPYFVSSILALMVGYNGAGFSLSLVGPIIGTINKDLGSKPYYAWIAIAWNIANAISVTVSGRLMDIFGRRYLMIFGNLLGVVACIVAGTADSVGVVICGVTILGYATGFQLQATACIAELVPNKYRPAVTGLVAFSLLIPAVFGAPIAYHLIEHASWRWSFWITLIVDAVACVLLILVYFPPTFGQKHSLDHQTKWRQLAEFDFFGLFLFIGSLISLLLGINWGGSTHPWKSAHVIVPIVVGGLGLVAFGFYEALMPLKAALIPKALLQDVRGFDVVIITIFVAGMLLYSLQVLWPTQIQTMYTTETMRIGWISCTFSAATNVGALALGAVLAKLGHARLIYVVVVALETAFVAGMAGMTPHSLGGAVTLVALAGLCVGCVNLVSVTMIILRCRDEYIGVAVGLAGTARTVGGAIATAIYSAVLNNKVNEVLPAKVAEAVVPLGFKPEDLSALITALTSGIPTANMTFPGISPRIISSAAYAIKDSHAEGFKLIYLIIASRSAV